MLGRLAKLAYRPHLPRRTVRLRLTLLYGALFLASGAALLAITYGLVSQATDDDYVVAALPGKSPARVESTQAIPPDLPPQAQQLRAQAEKQRSDQLRDLLVQSGVALALMAVISIGLGWLMAGRVLRPLRTMTATTRRISEQNLHERLALEGPRDELKDLGDTIDELLARLEAAFEAQRRFVANASHELRTPLSMMRTSLDVATAKPGRPSPEVEALDAKLREGLDRADRLLESFLTLARAQRGRLPQRDPVSLAQLAEAALADRRASTDAHRIAVARELRAAQAVGSETLLRHLVENLIDNAIRHNEEGGHIRIATRCDADHVLLSVASDGPRLTPEAVSKLAQPFRRLGAERTSTQNGSGLGLSIVEAIASAHDGELDLRARPEGGLRVDVRLPAGGGGAGRVAAAR
jgi:signal transduction histidine kinase